VLEPPAASAATSATPSSTLIIAAFASIYLIWGSTYLAIGFAVQTMPPFLMGGIRFMIAGALMYGWLRWRGEAHPTNLIHWRSAAIVGGLLLLGGNGGVVWAEQTVPSSVTALLIATVPMWIVLVDWLRPKGIRPNRWIVGGVALGLTGIVILIGPQNFLQGNQSDLIGPIVLVFASLSWAIGSVYSRLAALPSSPLMGTAMEMFAGGALLTILGTLTGEWGRLDLAGISAKSWVSLVYLILFGSLIGFTSYIWLLKVTTPARAATYAYVNPVVAVFLGWALNNEPITFQTIIAATIIITAVALIISNQGRRKST
jgi:drug/metabolite transporter (DMT)-like permease